MPTSANYQLIADNIFNLSHADFLHASTIGGMMTGARFTSREDGDTIVVE